MKKKLLDVPHYFLDILKGFENSGCGVLSLAMVLEFLSKKKIDIKKLKDEGVLIGARVPKYGWTQEGLASLARNKGFNAYLQEFRSVEVNLKDKTFKERNVLINFGINKIKELLKNNNPVLVSVDEDFNKNTVKHIVVLTGFDDSGFYFNDSRMKTGGKDLFVSFSRFKKYWRRRILVVYK